MRVAVLLLAFAFSLLAGACDDSPGTSMAPIGAGTGLDVNVTSLSPSTGASLLALTWLYDDGHGDAVDTEGARPLDGTASPPLSASLALAAPTHFYIDFAALRALPACSSGAPSGRCWDDSKPRPAGHGELAIGTAVVFVDTDGDGRFTTQPAEPLRAASPYFVLYARDLDQLALDDLGKQMLLNPGALRPGFNLAQVRCKDRVGWNGAFDPFEIVTAPTPLPVESLEARNARLMTGEICTNWS